MSEILLKNAAALSQTLESVESRIREQEAKTAQLQAAISSLFERLGSAERELGLLRAARTGRGPTER